MGILANTVSFCQYRVVGTPPARDPAAWAGEALAKGGFRPLDGTAEALSVGCVALYAPSAASFSSEPAVRIRRIVRFYGATRRFQRLCQRDHQTAEEP